MRIIRELGSPTPPRWNVRISYADIARRLGVDEETVRLRVKRARERGAFPEWRLTVNPRALDCEAVSLEVDVDAEERKAKAVAQIRLVDGVTKIIDYRGRGLQVTVYSEEGESLSRKVRLIESICGSARSAMWTSRFPVPKGRMTRTDWKIVNALKEDAGRDLAEVAASLGISARTVQRRLLKMRDGRAVFLSGAPNVGAVAGLVCCFVVFCPDGRRKRSVDASIHSDFRRVGHIDTSPEGYSAFGVPCENLAAADRVLDRLKAMEGVQDAGMRIMKEMILVQDWLSGEVEKRASEPSPRMSLSRGAGPVASSSLRRPARRTASVPRAR